MADIRVEVELVGEEPVEISYASVDAILDDVALQLLFRTHHVRECAIWVGKRRIAGVPICTWDRMRRTVTDSATAIMTAREMEAPC